MAITITNDAASTRTNLGLGDAATKTTGTGAGNVPLNSNLSTVATSGAYADVSGTPTLSTVATSGAYADVSGTPTFKTVGGTSIEGSGDIATLPSGGTANQVVTKNSSNNPVWADAAAAGKVLQVVDNHTLQTTGTFTDTGQKTIIALTMTPLSTTSKLWITASWAIQIYGNSNTASVGAFRLKIMQDTTDIYDCQDWHYNNVASNTYHYCISTTALVSRSSGSGARTFYTTMKKAGTNGRGYLHPSFGDSYIQIIEVEA